MSFSVAAGGRSKRPGWRRELPGGFQISVGVDSRVGRGMHRHDTLQLGLCTGGRGRQFDGRRYRALRSGAMYLLPPGRLHDGGPQRNATWSYVHLHLPMRQRWRDTPPDLFNDVPLAKLVRKLTAESNAARREVIVRRLTAVADRLTAVLDPRRDVDDAVAAVRSAIDASPRRGVDLDAVARRFDVTPNHLRTKFRDQIGLPPHAYQLQRRVETAKTWLIRGVDLGTIAVRLGFADQAHFTRVFRERVGMTPGVYARPAAESPAASATIPTDRYFVQDGFEVPAKIPA